MAVPTVTSVTPASVPLAGASVALVGTGFTGTTGVTVGGTAATSFTVVDDTHLTVVTPTKVAGTVDIIVTNATGAATAAAGDHITYIALPVVTAVSPTHGEKTGGNTVTLTGTALTGATAVKFGTVNAESFTVVSATSITAVAPDTNAGATHVTVVTTGGTSATGTGNAYTFDSTYTQPDGDSEFNQYFMDVELSPATLADGSLLERLDPIAYPQVGVLG